MHHRLRYCNVGVCVALRWIDTDANWAMSKLLHSTCLRGKGERPPVLAYVLMWIAVMALFHCCLYRSHEVTKYFEVHHTKKQNLCRRALSRKAENLPRPRYISRYLVNT